jgi:hypothetical protein
MRKLLFALVAVAMGAFAFASGTPASAAAVGAVTAASDIIKTGTSSVSEQVGYRRPHWRHRHWRHRHWRRHHRRCFWRYGRRYCRWGW